MGYYFRYLLQTEHNLQLSDIEKGLKRHNNNYSIQQSEVKDQGDLLYDDKVIAHIEINHPTEDIFKEDIEELSDTIGTPQTTIEHKILDQIHSTNLLIAIEAIWSGTQRNTTLDKLDPLWTWLFDNHPGILQADGEGFYTREGLILARNFTL